MARYPTFDEYAKKGAYNEGVKRCNDLLQRSPKDVQLLIVKLQFLCASSQNHEETLDALLAITPPIQDLRELVPIEAAIVDGNRDAWPIPTTAGPKVAKLWDNAFKANTSTNYRLELVTVRFSRAVIDDRIQDAQQSLISLKAVQPKNRAVYMAHAAYTQLLSSSKEDLSSRLALSLAKKAVSEKFDEDRALDCRIVGQIFAWQGAEKELEEIRERAAFRESKQVYEALKLSEKVEVNGASEPEKMDPEKVPPRVWLDGEVETLKKEFAKLIEANAAADVLKAFIANAIRLFHTSVTSLDLQGRDRGAADACFLAVSGLVKLYADTNDTSYLLQAAYLSHRLLKHNEHIHEARLILVYLYMRLNLGNLAIRMFDSLSVKEIQHDTIGHTLFSSLATTHPFRTQITDGWYEPHEKTHKALGVYPRHEDKLSETEASILDHFQTGMIFDLHDLRVNLRSSMIRRTFLLEHRRVARLTGKPTGKSTSEIGPRVVANWTNTKDNRDFNAAFDYGFNVENALFAEHSTESAQETLLNNLAADTAWCLATGKPSPLILDPENLPPKSTTTTSSPAQQISATIARDCLTLLTSLKAGTSPSKDQITPLQTLFVKLNINALIASPTPLAKHLQEVYLYIDTLHILSATCTYIKKHAEHIPQEVAKLQEAAKIGITGLVKYAAQQVSTLESRGVREQLGKDEGLKEAMGLFGEGNLHLFAEMVTESAREGWEGVGKIKMES